MCTLDTKRFYFHKLYLSQMRYMVCHLSYLYVATCVEYLCFIPLEIYQLKSSLNLLRLRCEYFPTFCFDVARHKNYKF